MNSDEVWARLTGVFREVFDDDEIVIAPATTARDVDGWSSLANIRLMISIEVEFAIRFDVGEFQEYRSVGDLVAGIIRRAG
jgi:acyl carrier protein